METERPGQKTSDRRPLACEGACTGGCPRHPWPPPADHERPGLSVRCTCQITDHVYVETRKVDAPYGTAYYEKVYACARCGGRRVFGIVRYSN